MSDYFLPEEEWRILEETLFFFFIDYYKVIVKV